MGTTTPVRSERTEGKPGAKAGFDALFGVQHPRAFRLAALLLGDTLQAEDVAARVLAKVWRRWSDTTIDDPDAYVRRAVINEVTSRWRRLGLERRELDRRRGDARGARAHTDDVVDRDLFLGALATLPPRMRAAVVLRYYEDLDVATTARVMGCSPGTVKSNTARGLDRLRATLGEES